MRTLFLVLSVALLAACSKPAVPPVENEPVKEYPLHGEVQSLDPQAKLAKIKHEAIGDWMEAMTMEFPVKDPQEFAKLKAGLRIDATVYVQGMNFWVGNIKPVTSP